MKKIKFKFICDNCKTQLTSPNDLIVYSIENGVITDLSYRHSGSCDDRTRFNKSRPLDNPYGIQDLLDEWSKSLYNKTK